MKVVGGKAVYGASVGILMLEARFPRIPGDMGNALTWPFPVMYKVVRDASPDRVVRGGAAGMLPAFIDAALELVADGVDGITTNCGFLSLFQAELAAAVGVPVAASSLMQVAQVNAILPPGKVAGILTISASSLTDAHLTAAGVPLTTPIGTTEGGQEFTRAILDNEGTGRGSGAGGQYQGGARLGWSAPRDRRAGFGMHQYDSLCGRYSRRRRPAGLFDGQFCDMVSVWIIPGTVRLPLMGCATRG